MPDKKPSLDDVSDTWIEDILAGASPTEKIREKVQKAKKKREEGVVGNKHQRKLLDQLEKEGY